MRSLAGPSVRGLVVLPPVAAVVVVVHDVVEAGASAVATAGISGRV